MDGKFWSSCKYNSILFFTKQKITKKFYIKLLNNLNSWYFFKILIITDQWILIKLTKTFSTMFFILKFLSIFKINFEFLIFDWFLAHPIKPDPSPYTGSVWMFEYSNYTQPLNYKERVAVASHLPSLGDQLLVVDSLTPNELNDPFWCTYGTNANGVLLINQEGTVVNSDTWFSAKKMEEAINNLIG